MNASPTSQPLLSTSEHLLSTVVAGEDSPQSSSSPSQSISDSLPNESEFQDLIQKYPFAAEATYFTRPNRYHGPASTWRSWTADDRAVVDALDQERAEDLAVHLYNAFALRKKAQTLNSYRQESLNPVTSRLNDANGDAINDDQCTSQQAFVPPALWTAWPLRGWEVPRRNRSRQNTSGSAMIEDVRPGGNLEETLIATTLKHAKEKWNTRELDPVPKNIGRKKRNWKIEREITMQQLIASGAVKRSKSTEQALESPDAIDNPALDNPNDDDLSDSDIEAPAGMQTFSSQAFHVESSSSEPEDVEIETEDSDFEPIFSADDDEARRKLLPSTRHVLSKLDDLLLGLHKARKAYAYRDSNRGVSTSLPVSASASMSRSRARSTEGHTDTDVEAKEDQHLRTGTFRSRNKRLRQERERGRKRQRSPSKDPSHPQLLGPRDWSDVIGMATLTGWKTETVARAAERCARLFDENMMFRTFHDPTQNEKENSYASYDEEFAYVSPETDGTNGDNDPMPLDSAATLRYIRTSSPCARCQTLNLRCDPPVASAQTETQPPNDPTSRVSCASCVATRESSRCSGISIKLTSPNPSSTSRVCPYESCRRHTHPFKKRYHLERHLRDVHHDSANANTDAEPPGKAQTAVPMIVRTKPTTTPEITMIGGTMRRGMELACPLPICQRHTHTYSRPARLYAHIKREHPDIDLVRFKELVSLRGESRRGKYDRSKTRSKSGSRSQSAVDSRGQGAVQTTIGEMDSSGNGSKEEEKEGEEKRDDDGDDDEHQDYIEMADYDENEERNGNGNGNENENVDESTTTAAAAAASARLLQPSDVEDDQSQDEQSDESV